MINKKKVEDSKQLAADNMQLMFLLWLTITNKACIQLVLVTNLIEIFNHFKHTEDSYHLVAKDSGSIQWRSQDFDSRGAKLNNKSDPKLIKNIKECN
jgi:hypothetical protein